jgi:hypothetical protein
MGNDKQNINLTEAQKYSCIDLVKPWTENDTEEMSKWFYKRYYITNIITENNDTNSILSTCSKNNYTD